MAVWLREQAQQGSADTEQAPQDIQDFLLVQVELETGQSDDALPLAHLRLWLQVGPVLLLLLLTIERLPPLCISCIGTLDISTACTAVRRSGSLLIAWFDFQSVCCTVQNRWYQGKENAKYVNLQDHTAMQSTILCLSSPNLCVLTAYGTTFIVHAQFMKYGRHCICIIQSGRLVPLRSVSGAQERGGGGCAPKGGRGRTKCAVMLNTFSCANANLLKMCKCKFA